MTNITAGKNTPKKWSVIIIGPPGSGKGTQADLLAEKFGLIHFEISRVIEEKFKKADPDDPIIQREKKIWKSGELMTPEIILQWGLEKITEYASSGVGIVMSGSPRTMYEAEGEVPALENLYGKENVKVVHLNLSKEESIKRNSARRICMNRHTIPDFPIFKDITACPKDGTALQKRELDNPETISVRYEVYLRRTQPILSFIESRDYGVIEIEGEQGIDDVFGDILKGLGEK